MADPALAASAAAPSFRSIAAQDLYRDYGRQRALAGVSLSLAAGQVTALLGENGAGKSTLLSILAGMQKPSRGQVLVDEQPLSALDDTSFRRCLGVLSHEPRCYAELSPRENLHLFAKIYDLPDSAALGPTGGEPGMGSPPTQSIEKWLQAVGLSRAADRPARTLSRGMLQRLAIARTLLHRPSLILLDEPYTGLDPAGVELLSQLLVAERARGAMILVVTHDLATVAPLCDQVVVLCRGRVGASATVPHGSASGDSLLALYRQAEAQSTRGGRPGRAAAAEAERRA